MTHHASHSSLSQALAWAAAGDWVRVRALGSEPEDGKPAARLALLLAEAELRVGDPAVARGHLLAAIVSLEQGGDPAGRRLALNLLGAAQFELGALDEAEQAFTSARDLATAAGDHLMFARTTNNLGTIANLRGQHQVALSLYRLAIPAFQRSGNAAGLAEVHHNIAITFRDLERLDEAEDAELQAFEFAGQAGARRLRAMALVGRAELLLRRGDVPVAEAWARTAATDYASLPDPVGEADALRVVATARLELGVPGTAREPVHRAVELARRHGSALVEAEALEVRARYHDAVGQPDQARADASEAMQLYRRVGDDRAVNALQRWLGVRALNLGESR
jgi:tetratricopeptide (TPR) repeat protein